MDLPDFKAIAADAQAGLGADALERLLERGREWRLGHVLSARGAIVFPHAGLAACGGPEREPWRGVQGPGADGSTARGRDDWRREFSLDHSRFLLTAEAQRRRMPAPEVIARFPFLVGDDPSSLPGIAELEELVGSGAAVVATADPVHHGRAYGDASGAALAWAEGGAAHARSAIEFGLELLRGGPFDTGAWLRHCLDARSDARDVGPVLRGLLGPLDGTILDLAADDMTHAYGAPPPRWVATALIRLVPRIPA